jgi:hypothetical protein
MVGWDNRGENAAAASAAENQALSPFLAQLDIPSRHDLTSRTMERGKIDARMLIPPSLAKRNFLFLDYVSGKSSEPNLSY